MSDEIKRLAVEMESMLLSRMLREMREAGRWDDESEQDGLGASAFFETLDAELARHLAHAQGLGLSSELEGAVRNATVDANGTHEAVVHEPTQTPLQFAVPSSAITSEYGWRRDPFSGAEKFHRGIDVRAAYGDAIQAAGAGRVVFSGEQGGYGTTVVIEHAGGVRTRYAHLSSADVREGESVSPGQIVGRAGHSGRATGTHLHFEVTVNGQHVSPSDWGLTPPGGRQRAE